MSALGEVAGRPLSWLGIFRLGLVQTAIGAIFVLSTSTLNRVMVIELGLPAMLPGALIGLHFALQLARPRLGFASDLSGRRTPWIIGGMLVLAAGALLAALATGLMTTMLVAGVALAILAFGMIGLGVAACGTALLVLMAARCAPARRPAAAIIAWVMMIVGFILTAIVASRTLDPFSPHRLLAVAAMIASAGVLVTALATWGIEGATPEAAPAAASRPLAFGPALREVWADRDARRFTLFITLSMLAYGSEEFLLEPFAASAFGLGPAATARLNGLVNGGTLGGMALLGLASPVLARGGFGVTRGAMTFGCLGCALGLVAVAATGLHGDARLLAPAFGALGIANGLYAGAAIGAMMQLVGLRGGSRAGVRMGLWGAAQAVAQGVGGLLATTLLLCARAVATTRPGTYALVLALEAAAFVAAAALALTLAVPAESRPSSAAPAHGG